ncbi:hypothetical protein D3C80_1263360 [compost metagenome]
MLQRINGGSRDTELKLLAVTPTLRPLTVAAVTTVTPVAKLPRARRKARVSKVVSSSADMGVSRAALNGSPDCCYVSCATVTEERSDHGWIRLEAHQLAAEDLRADVVVGVSMGAGQV